MEHDFVNARRWIAALSGVGAANMALASMRQLGLLKHLPDPPIRGFDSDAVVVSPSAFALSVPDGPIALAAFSANVPLAFFGGPRRARERPWIPILIACKTIAEVSVAGWYLVQMRTRVHAWCAYCLASTALSATIAILAIREAAAALSTPRSRAAGVGAALLIAGICFATMSLLDARHRHGHRAKLPSTPSAGAWHG